MKARQCDAICSRCGRSYRAFSSRAKIAYKLRKGNGIYCPKCVVERQRETAIRNNLERRLRKEAIVNGWLAACGQVIVPKERKRCNTFTKHGCDDYETCLDFCARQDWQGWGIA